MAAGAKRKFRQTSGKSAEAEKPKPAASKTTKPKAQAAAAKTKAGPVKAKAKSPASRKASSKKAPAKTKRKTAKPVDADMLAMMQEQNNALRAELDQAQERIAELEELNKNVVNRIDWVIDSLQGLLPKR